MSKEEIIEFLKDNLKISIETENGDYSTGKQDYVDVKVQIRLGDELISESTSDFCITK